MQTQSTAQDIEMAGRVNRCPTMASLKSIKTSLGSLAREDYCVTTLIAETISKDPSLSVRLLRLANSAYFGLSTRASSIEDAVLFLGHRKIREISLATLALEELEAISGLNFPVLPWKSLWAHSIGTAVLTRDLLGASGLDSGDDTGYLAGLLHNCGKVTMAYLFPDQLTALSFKPAASAVAFTKAEQAMIGWDHARIGGQYLARFGMPEEVCFAAQYHCEPENAPRHQLFAAAVQVADHVLRHLGTPGGFEIIPQVGMHDWTQLSGWRILFPDEDSAAKGRKEIKDAMGKLPLLLQEFS